MTAREKIGIMGIGMVGAPLARYFMEIAGYQCGTDLFLYDTDKAKKYSDDVGRADIVFICVPTPRMHNGSANISLVSGAIAMMKEPKIVVIKSTVPPGTTEHLQKKYPQHRILFNPEFLTEQNAWEQTLNPDRQFVGWTAKSKNIADRVLSLLPQASLATPSEKLNISATEAEIIKYGANIFLARKVVFANALYNLAKHQGVNYENIRVGLGSDPRIGSSHLDVHHGGYRGYGGYCFIKDTDAFIAHAKEKELNHIADLISADARFNTITLADQGLTPEDVAVHDHEWIKKKIKLK